MMSTPEIATLVRNILHNCGITDAKHAGLYSVCGLAMRLRDLYKWENRLPPWEERNSAEIIEWIGDKEQLWDDLTEEDFVPLPINGSSFGPFDTQAVNARLEPQGYFYGAGYAYQLKPTFFLARIESKETIEGCTVYSLGQELARDLLTIPALAQDGCILLRQDAGRMFLWDQMFYIKKSGRPALQFALECCGLSDQTSQTLRNNLDTLYAAQRDTYIYHEIGEIQDTVFDTEIWREVIAAFPHSPVELLTRSVKDLLADTGKFGTLPHIIRNRQAVSLGLYVAFFDGLVRELFPELRPAFSKFQKDGNWQIIKDVVSVGNHTARKSAQTIMDLFSEGRDKNNLQWARDEIERALLPS